MSERKRPLLVNVPQTGVASAEELQSIRSSGEAAAQVLRTKVHADRQHRRELIEGIRDATMREGLKKGAV
ncbi:MAG: hypothetical protein JOY64_19530 [Alphaproteobacteria bacterium]|nr:hypothetical protein [Alphaproteobacteria bacterium]MBV8409829.1 hypothetical protein [Alphaproteobacteria bacterium]